MVKVIFAPGCYGTFLSKCLYYLTDIAGTVDQIEFVFDESGSSHDLRNVSDFDNYIVRGHPSTNHGTIEYDQNDTIIVIVPCNNNRLDYFDNQFCKQEQFQIVSHVNQTFSSKEIEQKLLDGWNYDRELDLSTPNWILREWCSFWLEDCLANGYDASFFAAIPAVIHITTQDLFVDLATTLNNIAQAINVNVVASIGKVRTIQHNFIAAQKMHGIQIRCERWVDDVLSGKKTQSPCVTLFDEAWVQHLLREKGYELQCYDLEHLPTSSDNLTDLIYQNNRDFL